MSGEQGSGWDDIYRGSRSPWVVIGFLASLAFAVAALDFAAARGVPVGGNSNLLGGFILIAMTVPALLFGLRFFFSLFTTVSVISIFLGVGVVTLALAITNGFQHDLRDRVLGVNAHIVIMSYTDTALGSSGPGGYPAVEKTIREIDGVAAVEPFIFAEMLLTTQGTSEIFGVAVKGIIPERATDVLDLEEHMLGGVGVSVLSRAPAREGEPPPVIIGTALAKVLKVDVGDEFSLAPPRTDADFETWTVAAEPPQSKRFRVAGIFHAGFYEYDRHLVYISLADAQQLLGQPDQVMGVEAVVTDIDEAARIADEIESALGGPPFLVMDWHQLNQNLFTALSRDKRDLLPLLALLLGVAPFLMIAAMAFTDTRRDIAILRRMGATLASARRFRVAAVFAAGLGTVLGLAITLGLCRWLESRELSIDPTVYLLDYMPTAMSPIEVLLVAGSTLLLATVLSLLVTVRARSLPGGPTT